MDKVYLVIVFCYDEVSEIYGCYSSREKAEKVEQDLDKKYPKGIHVIKEMAVD